MPALMIGVVGTAETALFPTWRTLRALRSAHRTSFIGCREKSVISARRTTTKVASTWYSFRIRTHRTTFDRRPLPLDRCISLVATAAIMSDDDSLPHGDRRSRCAPDCISAADPRPHYQSACESAERRLDLISTPPLGTISNSPRWCIDRYHRTIADDRSNSRDGTRCLKYYADLHDDKNNLRFSASASFHLRHRARDNGKFTLD